MEIKLNLPLHVWPSRKKKFILNLNNYRNAHYQTLNKAKILYSDNVKDILSKKLARSGFKYDTPVTMTYTYFHGNKRRVDVGNPCSVIDKFTCDALTDYGIWSDDNSSVIKGVSFCFGGIDKLRPRCELVISPVVSS